MHGRCLFYISVCTFFWEVIRLLNDVATLIRVHVYTYTIPHRHVSILCVRHNDHGIHTGRYVGSDKNWFDNPPNLPNFAGTYREYSIEDSIVIPSNIPAGDYVLGWRWDCEQTTQIWANCADITIE